VRDNIKVLNLALLCENFSDEFPDTTGSEEIPDLICRLPNG
jgi:hypothetical protein